MSLRSRVATLSVLALLVASCKDDAVAPPVAQATLLQMQASAQSVSADGTSVVQVAVSRPTQAAVTLTAERGTWSDSGSSTTTLPTGSGTVQLLTCDARTDAGCVGLVRISGSSADHASGSIVVQFLSPELCANGKDDDVDGKSDCTDSDCQGEACTLAGSATGTGICGAANSCVCATGQTELCDNGADDDCDGASDCADLDCQPTAGRAGASCTLSGSSGTQCSASGVCNCPGGEAQESTCGDGADNDCDGNVDCVDADCMGEACGADGVTCSSGTPAACSCPTGANEVCTDGVDNNCDGKADCEDSACADQQCKVSGSNWVCSGTSSSCEDTSTSLALATSADRVRLPANGTATTRVLATLTGKDGPLAGKTVQFSILSGPGTLAPAPAAAVTDAEGVASVTFTAGAAGGVTRIQAAYDTAIPTVGVMTQTLSVTQAAVGQVAFVSQQFPIMGVRSSSYQESNALVFRVLDTQGQPFPDGLDVTVTHAGLGRELTSYIGETPADCDTSSRLCSISVTTGDPDNAGSLDSGLVKVRLHSGSAAGVLSVKVDASAGGRSAQTVASDIAVVGAKAFGQNISITCDPKNVPALTEHDCSKSFVDATITCRVTLADRFNNVLGIPRMVDFRSEAGAASLPGQSSTAGEAVGTVLTHGFALPVDVDPYLPAVGDEYSLNYSDECGPSVHNPRDGVVSVLAAVRGEEGFIDGSSGFPANGLYDPGEKFIDLGEPFVDSNDNNLRDFDEQYVDANGNGICDPPNGMWDGEALIWAETRVTYTGEPNLLAGNAATRWLGAGTPPAPTAQPVFAVSSAATMAPAPATSDFLDLFYTDVNFNPPNEETQFSLAPSGDFQAEFYEPVAPRDYRGHVLIQQYCDATDSTARCAATCLYERCVRRSTVKDFVYGSVGTVKITGGAQPGAGSVNATSLLRGHTLRMGVAGSAN